MGVLCGVGVGFEQLLHLSQVGLFDLLKLLLRTNKPNEKHGDKEKKTSWLPSDIRYQTLPFSFSPQTGVEVGTRMDNNEPILPLNVVTRDN